MRQIAVIGAGHMARIRGRALLATGRAVICAVASRDVDHARTCARDLAAPAAFTDFRRIAACHPDAILIETPHRVHDDVVPWGLEAGYDLLIGGSLATSVESGERFIALAQRNRCVVECGYDRRYHPAWVALRDAICAGGLGRPIQAYATGLFAADPASWYYDDAASGGMPLTHLPYVGLSYIRWIFGRPIGVVAVASRVVETKPSRVEEESCVAIVEFANGAFATVIGGYVAPEGLPSVLPQFVCADGGASADAAAGTLTLYQKSGPPLVHSYPTEPSQFVLQADAFLDALERRAGHRNPPEDAIVDVRLAAAIRQAARERRRIPLT